MGGYYAIVRADGRLPWINFALSAGGAILMAPMLAWLLADAPHRGPTIGPLMMIPELMVMAGLAVFLFEVVTTPKSAGATAA